MDHITNNDAIQAIINLTVTLKEIWPVVMKMTSFIGFLFVAASIFLTLSPQYSMMMRSSLSGLPSKKSMLFFFAGIFLIQLATFIFHISDTIFRNSSLSSLSYQALKTGVSKTGTVGVYIAFAVAVIMFVGLIAIVKGIIGYAVQDGNPQALGAAIFNIGIGSLCINFKLIMQEIGVTLGGVYQSNIDKFF